MPWFLWNPFFNFCSFFFFFASMYQNFFKGSSEELNSLGEYIILYRTVEVITEFQQIEKSAKASLGHQLKMKLLGFHIQRFWFSRAPETIQMLYIDYNWNKIFFFVFSFKKFPPEPLWFSLFLHCCHIFGHWPPLLCLFHSRITLLSQQVLQKRIGHDRS